MTQFLLDTNILSDVIRNPDGRVGRQIDALDDSAIATSAIVACELRFGARKKGSTRLARRVDETLGSIIVHPFDAPADHVYAELRCQLESAGTPISATDMLIAAHALALDAVLVTDNEREFRRVVGLRMVNWLR